MRGRNAIGVYRYGSGLKRLSLFDPMSFARLLLFSISACLLGVGCGKQAEAPAAPVAPEASSANPKPKQKPLPPPVSAPVFTLKDFDKNSSDHNPTKKTIGVAVGDVLNTDMKPRFSHFPDPQRVDFSCFYAQISVFMRDNHASGEFYLKLVVKFPILMGFFLGIHDA